MIFFLSVLSGILYRLGGKKGFNTKFRDFGVPIVCLFLMMKVKCPWYDHALAGVLLFGSLTTYWQEVFGEDNFFLHGAGCGLAYLPYIFVIPWQVIIGRALILGFFMYGVNKLVNTVKVPRGADVEEFIRGFSIAMTTIFM